MKFFKGNRETRLILEYCQNVDDVSFEISAIIPIYNQEAAIEEVILGVLNSMTSDFELILIDDGSNDDTSEILISIEHHFRNCTRLKMVRVYRNGKPKFETYCDSFGFDMASNRYILEIQADMILDDKGFERRMINALECENNLVAISGRGVEPLMPIVEQYRQTLGTDRAHNSSLLSYIVLRCIAQIKIFLKKVIKSDVTINYVKEPGINKVHQEVSDEEFLNFGYAGRLGEKATHEITREILSNKKIYIGETVMRGPIIFDRDKYIQVGGLNCGAFFQGFDDHDFCARALLMGFRVGYTPVKYSSPLSLGTTRKPRSIHTEIEIFKNILRIQIRKKKSPLNSKTTIQTALSDTQNIIKNF